VVVAKVVDCDAEFEMANREAERRIGEEEGEPVDNVSVDMMAEADNEDSYTGDEWIG